MAAGQSEREEMGVSLSLVALVVASKPLRREEVEAAVRETPHERVGPDSWTEERARHLPGTPFRVGSREKTG